MANMMNFKTDANIPQVGRIRNPKSHTYKKVSLTDSGGGKNSQISINNRKLPSTKLHIITYNIRTMKSAERLVELEEELTHIKWDIVGLCETRLPEEKCTTLKTGHILYQNNGEEDTHLGGVAILVHRKIKHLITKMRAISPRVIYVILKISKRYNLQIIQVYAPTSASENDEVEQLYEDISLAQRSEKTQFTIVMGDFNAKIGNINKDNIPNRGNFGLGSPNERGDMLINYLQNENMYCMNTFFKKQIQRRWTWNSPDSRTKNEIDYIITNKKFIITDVSVLNKLDAGSDHRPIRATVRINIKAERNKLMTKPRVPTIEQLKQNADKYQAELKKKLSNKDNIMKMEINELENKIRTDIKTVTKNICSKLKTSNSKIKEETRKLMKDRRNMSKESPEYVEINKEIKKKIRKDIRKYNTEQAKTVIENNKNMKVLRTAKTTGRARIHQLRNTEGEIKQDKNQITSIVENFYKNLYSSTNPEPYYIENRRIMNIGSEEIPNININEIEHALTQIKNNRAPGEDGVTTEMLKMGGTATLESIEILLNKCLSEGKIPNTWQNAKVILLYKKGDKLKIDNYRPISLLPHPYKLLTKIITNRLTNKFDEYQPPEQAGFRKGYSTIEHIQTIRTLIEKCSEYNVPLHLAFVDYNKAFDSVELWAIYKAMDHARIDSRYKNLLKHIYEKATLQVEITEDQTTDKIPLKKGVRQGDTISPKLFTLALEDVFKKLEWSKKGINIDGRYLNHLRFADDIVLISNNLEELREMLTELKTASEEIGLKMNMGKTKIMTTNEIAPQVREGNIEEVDEYIYLGHMIKLGKENQTAEVNRRVRMTWAATGKLGMILKNHNIPINLKRKVFNACILPVMTYGMETMTLTIKSANKLRTTQRAIERLMLGISLRDHNRNEQIRRKTKVEDVMKAIATMKWRWVGHVARQEKSRWTKHVTQWRPRLHKRSVGRPQRRWIDDIIEHVGRKWHQLAQDRRKWKEKGEAYVQEWTVKGC